MGLPEVVIHVDLTDRHPFEVSPHRVHLPLIYTDAHTVFFEAIFGVIEAGEAIAVSVVCDLVIVPSANGGQILSPHFCIVRIKCNLRGDPCKLLVRQREVLVGTVCCDAAAVVVEGEDLTLRFHRSGVGGSGIFVNVVTKLLGH